MIYQLRVFPCEALQELFDGEANERIVLILRRWLRPTVSIDAVLFRLALGLPLRLAGRRRRLLVIFWFDVTRPNRFTNIAARSAFVKEIESTRPPLCKR